MKTTGAIPAVGLLILGCTAEQLGLPRLELTIISPDKQSIVEVHNDPSIDPPQQSLWIGRRGGELQKVTDVSCDGPKWRGPSAWSHDGKLFAFAIVDRDVYVVEAETGAIRVEGESPGGGARHEIRSLSFNPSTTMLTIEVCDRVSRDCMEVHEPLDGRAPSGKGLRRKLHTHEEVRRVAPPEA
jgi:hypothetical protein